MKTAVNKKLYEAMFLVDAAEAESSWDTVESNVRSILERVDAQIISLRKWDTRRLAYDINKKSRGTYILCYFRVDGKRIAEIERTAQLSERIMRVLVLSAEHVRQEDIERETPATAAAEHGQTPGVEAAEAAAGDTKAEAASADEDSEMDAEAVTVFEETVEESRELEGQAETRGSSKRLSKRVDALAAASEPEQAEDETKGDSELADEPEADTSERVEE